MTVQTKDGDRRYEYVGGNAWEGARWQGDKDFPFATGRVYGAWQEPTVTNPEQKFEVTRDLITWNTEKAAGRYEIYERIEGQDNRRYVGATLTARGAKRKIARRVLDVTNRLVGEIVANKFREGQE